MKIGDESRYLATVTAHYSFFKCCHLGEILCLCKTAVNNVNDEINGTERGEVGNDKEETRDIPAYVKHHKPHIGTHYGFPFSATLASEDGSDILKMGCS